MDTTIVFSIKDLIYVALWIALIALVVYIILLIREALLSLKEIRLLVKERRLEIDDILIQAPKILENVNQITGVTARGVNSAYDGASKLMHKFKDKKAPAKEEANELHEEIIG